MNKMKEYKQSSYIKKFIKVIKIISLNPVKVLVSLNISTLTQNLID